MQSRGQEVRLYQCPQYCASLDEDMHMNLLKFYPKAGSLLRFWLAIVPCEKVNEWFWGESLDNEHTVELKKFEWNNFRLHQVLEALWEVEPIKINYYFERLLTVFCFSFDHKLICFREAW